MDAVRIHCCSLLASQSSHPLGVLASALTKAFFTYMLLALFCLYLFKVGAVATYILCGFITENYVLSVRCIPRHECFLTQIR